MIKDMLSALICTSVMSQAQEKPPVNMADLKQYTLLIFESGERKREYTQEELTKMQEGHIANLVRLYAEKKSPVAGPFGDAGAWRGIVILDLPKDKVPAEFTNDPFVKDGLLKISLHTWTMHKNSFAWPEEDLGMDQFVFVRLLKGPKWSADVKPEEQNAHLKHNVEMSNKGLVAVVGPMTSPDEKWRGTYIFYGKDLDKVKAEIMKDPRVKAGHFEPELKPLYLGKGLFNKPNF